MKDLLKHLAIAAVIGAWFGFAAWAADVAWLPLWGWLSIGATWGVVWFLGVYLFCRRLS